MQQVRMGASDIFMKLYVGDYLADTGDLSTEENGAYMLLLMHMWRQGGALESDSGRLRRLAKVESNERWSAIWSALERFFVVLEDGKVSQKRLAEEYRKAAAFAELQSKRGAAGGKAKAERSKSSRRLATASPRQNPASPRLASQSQSQSQRSDPETKSEGLQPDKPAENLHAEILKSFGQKWESRYRAEYIPTPADKSQLGNLLRSIPTGAARAELPGCFDEYLRDSGRLETERRHDLAFFCTQGGFNRYRVRGSPASQSKTAQAFQGILRGTGT